MATLTIDGSSTSIEGEYRALCRGIARCKQHEVAFDPRPYAPSAVAEARDIWRLRMRSEHESAPVFAALAIASVEAHATFDMTGVLLRMAADEVRHAEICGEAARALGGDGTCEAPAELMRLPPHPGAGPEERMLRDVIWSCCLVEVVNTANLVDWLDTTSDPYLHERLRLLLADEALHGQFGFEYLEAWTPWMDANPAVRRSLEGYLRRAFAEHERLRSGNGAPPRVLTADEVALGIPDPKRLPEVYYQTMEAAVVPGLERFGLDATTAWRTRSLTAG